MGTSISQASPRTESWEILRKLYIDADIPIDRVVQEMWRADRREEDSLVSLLATDVISQIFAIACQDNEPSAISSIIADEASNWNEVSLSIDIACRAAISSTHSEARAVSFISNVFGEAADYLASRDIPGLVGLGTRIKNIPESAEFKANLVRSTKERAAEIAKNNQFLASESWKEIVSDVVYGLARLE